MTLNDLVWEVRYASGDIEKLIGFKEAGRGRPEDQEKAADSLKKLIAATEAALGFTFSRVESSVEKPDGKGARPDS